MSEATDHPGTEGRQRDETTPDEGADDPPDEGAEGPDLEEDDYADLPDDLVAEVAAEDAAQDAESDEESDAPEDEGEDTDGDASDSETPTDTLTTGTSVGDLYCNALGMGATLARDRKGSGVANREAKTEEYADMARQLDLDDFVNEWVEAHGGAGELSPGQGIVFGTTMFAVAVMVEDPDLADGLASEVGS